MTRDHARQQVLDFLDAIYSRNAERALEFFHDDIDFIGHAPVQFFPYLGHRRGKEQLRETLLAVQTRYSRIRHEVVFIAADDDKVATILKAYLQKRASERVVQIQVADFYRFQDGLIVEQRQFLDSFDVVQQVLERDVTDLIGPIPGD